MKSFRWSVTIGLCLFLVQSVFPQQKTKSEAKREAERIRKEQQAQARSLLISLASDARSFRDQTLRARSLARIADALWDVDSEQGKTLFRKAWEAAEIANSETNERLNVHDGVVSLKPEEVNGATLSAIASTPDVRKEVLRLVASHDRTLSEEFLEKLKESQAETKSENTSSSLWDLPDALQQRLSLAENLLNAGNTERLDGGDLDRPRAFVAIAHAWRVVESARVSEAIFDAVKAANSTDGFTGEGGMVTQTMNSKGVISVRPQPVADFDIAELFGALANEDYDRAVQLARGFQGEAARANATIAIARAVLNEKRVPTP